MHTSTCFKIVNKFKISKFVRFKFKDFSGIFKYFQTPYLFQALSRALKFLFQIQWSNDGVAAASSDGGPHWWWWPPAVLEFLVINFSVCLVLLRNCFIIIYQRDFCYVLIS